MAFRRPLVTSGSNMREMNDTEINIVRSRVRYLYMHSPSVRLDVVGSGGNLGTLYDTRLAAGAYSTSTTAYPVETTTAEPYVVSVGYSRLNQVVESAGLTGDDGKRYPVYYDGGNIRAMTYQDMFDTFIWNGLYSAYADMYYISNSYGFSGWSPVSSLPIFSDTGANTGAYTADAIPETQDQPYTRQNFWLHRHYPGDPGAVNPLKVNSGNNLQEYTTTDFDNILRELGRYVAANVGGYRNRFGWNATNSTRWDRGAVWDDRLNGGGNYQTRFVNGDDYRAQEFPDGSFVRISTWYLRSYVV